MEEFHYKVCFKHCMVKQINGTGKWVYVANAGEYNAGENINYSTEEVYHIEECECPKCEQYD